MGHAEIKTYDWTANNTLYQETKVYKQPKYFLQSVTKLFSIQILHFIGLEHIKYDNSLHSQNLLILYFYNGTSKTEYNNKKILSRWKYYLDEIE